MRAHLFLGSDAARRTAAFEQAVNDWRSQVSPMDLDVFDLKDPGQQAKAASTLRMPPLAGPARLVVWKGLDAFTKVPPALQAELEENIPQAHPDVVLIAEAKTATAAKNRPATLATPVRPLAELLARADTQTFDAAAWWDASGQQKVVLEMAKEAGVKMTPELATTALAMVGADTGRIKAALAQLALMGEPASKRLLRSLLVADHADLEAFHLLAVRGKTREALALIPQFEAAEMKPAEAVIKLQNLALRTLAVSHSRAKDDAVVSAVSGIPERQLYFRRKEWGRLKQPATEAALAAATTLAEQLGQGRKLPLQTVLRTYLALSRGL